MSTQCFTPGFKEEAVPQVIERGYLSAKLPAVLVCRFTACTNQMGKWAAAPGKMEQRGGEYGRPRVGFQGCEHLRRNEVERDILKSRAAFKKINFSWKFANIRLY